VQGPQGAAPNAEPPGAASEAAIVQTAVEQFVELHSCGEAPALDAFVLRFPEAVRARVFAQIREFLAFDGLLGHQEWAEPATTESHGRAFGDFVIQEELGRGGMGVVYLAHQKSLNRRVALKVMASGLTLSKRHVERFRREAAATAQLRHPAIVQVHSFTEVDGTIAFAMDFVAGRNLADRLDDLRLGNSEQPGAVEGSLGVQPGKGYTAECAILCVQLASALSAAHQKGIVHRDLKPRNVMVDERGQVRLLDFGLAKSLGEGSISMSGEITGTAHYMSPEQTLAKRVEVDHRADIWALGVILFELLTLKRPFDGKNLQQIVYEICFKEPAALQKLNPKVPRDLVTICGKALEKDPAARYQTAADFEADLLRFLRWEPILAKPAGPLVRLSKWVHRHRTESMLTAAATVLALGAIGYAWYDAQVTNRRYEECLRTAVIESANGNHDGAVRSATEACILRDDKEARTSLQLYQERATGAATKRERDIAESRRLSLESTQAIPRDREKALLLALEAVQVRPSAESRSAVMAALGSGFRTTKFEVPGSEVFTSRWSPDGRLVVTTGPEKAVGNAILWDSNGTMKFVLHGHREFVLDAAFHPNGNLLATAGADGTVRLWNTHDGSAVGLWQHTASVTRVRFDRDGKRALTTCNNSKTSTYQAQVWDTATGKCIASCTSHKRIVLAAALSPCGNYVASAGDPGFVRLWDANTGAELAQLRGHPAPRGVAFSPDGSLVAVADSDGTARLFAVPSGTLLCRFAHSRQINVLTFDATGERLLTGARDQTARLWRIEHTTQPPTANASEMRTFVGHIGDINHVAFDASGQFVVTAAADGVLRVFDASNSEASNGTELMRFEVGSPVEEAAFDPDSRRILAQVGSQRALVWDFADTRGTATLRQPGRVPAACFDASGDRIVTAGDDERVRFWNAHDGRMLWITRKLGNPVRALDVDDAGERFAVSLQDGRVQVRRLADGDLLFTLTQQDGRVPIVRFAAHGTRLLSASSTGHAIVWNANDHTVVQEITRPAGLAAADLSPDGQLLATVDQGAHVAQVWSVGDGTLLHTLSGAAKDLLWVRFRPDGNALLLAGLDDLVQVLTLDGAPVVELAVGNPVHHAAWSRDGAFVLTCSRGDDNRVRLWRAGDGTEVLHFSGHTLAVNSCTFSPDGTWAASTAKDETIRIWPTDPVAAAHRLQLRALTASEREAHGITAPTDTR
jgi:eukaryotic-like serine/threonine-protein kinase